MKKLLLLIAILVPALLFAQSTPPIAADTGRFVLPTGGAAAGAHAAGDVVGPSLTAASCPLIKLNSASRSSTGLYGGYITGIKIVTDSATTGSLTITFVKDTAGMTYMADNAAYAPTGEQGTKVLATETISFSTQGTSGSSRAIAEGTCLRSYTVKSGQSAIYMRISCAVATTFKYGGIIWYEVTYDRN